MSYALYYMLVSLDFNRAIQIALCLCFPFLVPAPMIYFKKPELKQSAFSILYGSQNYSGKKHMQCRYHNEATDYQSWESRNKSRTQVFSENRQEEQNRQRRQK